MNHTFETAANLLIKIAAINRPAMTHDNQMIYDRAYFKGLLENLIVFVPEARDYIEEFYSIAQKLHSSEKP
jgi:hypothetical protein